MYIVADDVTRVKDVRHCESLLSKTLAEMQHSKKICYCMLPQSARQGSQSVVSVALSCVMRCVQI